MVAPIPAFPWLIEGRKRVYYIPYYYIIGFQFDFSINVY
jgi:hypothetical protein